MWHLEVLSLELKRRAIYAVDFWLKMVIPPAAQIMVAYFLWSSIYEHRGVSEIGGRSFPEMILYYVIAASLYQMVQPEMGLILREIYHGTLTKFLFYPVSIFEFKFVSHLAQILLLALQLLLALFVYASVFGWAAVEVISLSAVFAAIPVVFLAGLLFFVMAATLEVIGLWVESAWGLVVMLQMITSLLGGKLIPLSLFPEWLQISLAWSPFPYLLSFPTEVLLGAVSSELYLQGLVLTVAWITFFAVVTAVLWKRGSYHYAGTGM